MKSNAEIERLSPTKFANDLRKQIVQKGAAIVPFVGAGLSLESGIPTISQFEPYLLHCVDMAVVGKGRADKRKRWDPRKSKWPAVHWPESAERGGGDPSTKRKLAARIGKSLAKPDPSHRDDAMAWHVKGALADWRSALAFLCRVTEDKKGDLVLRPEDDLVRDSFFKHIVTGHRPNLGHFMLAHLADPMRIQTVLTTNFDSLLEEAFETLRVPLSTFDVHQRADLPDPRLVLGQRSIIKLHGAKYGMRADETLDEQASDADKDAFRGYFAAGGEHRPPKHLLVMGFSGHDERMVSLFKNAVKLGNITRIYWVCYSNADVNWAQDHLREWGGKLKLIQHHDAGLLMLEVYQRLCLSLPPAGAEYPFMVDVPPIPYCPEGQCPFAAEGCEPLREALVALVKASSKEAPPVLRVTGGPEVSRAAARVCEDLRDEHQCVWLGMDDYYEATDFFVNLVQAVARRLGVPAVTPPSSVYDPSTDDIKKRSAENCRAELSRYLWHRRSPIIVFLDATDGYGMNAGTKRDEWDETELAPFCYLLKSIRQPGIVFCLLDKDSPGLTAWISKDGIVQECVLNRPKCNVVKWEQVRSEIAAWLGKKPHRDRKLCFLYAMTLFRHSRHYAALCSWALMRAIKRLSVGLDNDGERCRLGNAWLKRLLEARATRMKPGGLVWMHEDVKQHLRDWLEGADGPAFSDGTHPVHIAWECHRGIADWYVKLFRSSNDPMAVLESVYQRVQCIDRSDQIEDEGVGFAQYVRETALIEAIVTLRLARDRILTCGYFRACENLIEAIEDKAALWSGNNTTGDGFRDRARQLLRECIELRREFSASLADFDQAMERNKQLKADEERERKEEQERLETSGGAGRTGDGDDQIGELYASYYDAKYLTGLRCYGLADTAFVKLLDQMGIHGIEKLIGKPKVKRARELGREWASGLPCGSEEKLALAMRALRRYMFLHMLIAQIEELNGNEELKIGELRAAEMLYTMATEIMRYADDERVLQFENAYIRMNYSVVLSNLGRPLEAHRRLNEAAGYLYNSEKRYDPVAWAVLDLRRAEVYLDHVLRARQRARPASIEPTKKGQAVSDDRLIAWLDSAHVSLTRAREELTGHREDIWWWTWMHELELTVCHELARIKVGDKNACALSLDGKDIALACAACTPQYERFAGLVGEDLGVICLDVLRLARLGDLLLGFREAQPRSAPSKNLDRLRKKVREQLMTVRKAREQDADHAPDGRVLQYVAQVLSNLER